MIRIYLFACLLTAALPASAQYDSIMLYTGAVPGAIRKPVPENVRVNPNDGVTVTGDIQDPVLYIHRPARPNGTAVLICPGGGYYVLAMDHEGHHVAKWFTERGVTAFVLKSRLPDERFMTQMHMRPLQDAQQAMRIIRGSATRWGIDPQRIGVMGFSAGGHLASTLATHFSKQVGEITGNISVRPDFLVLGYPMISYQPAIYTSSQNRLLGDHAPAELKNEYSNELHVDAATPPTFIFLSSDDFLPPANSIAFFAALQKHKVPVELHVYERGGHGYAMSGRNKGHVNDWPRELEGWLKDRALLPENKK